MTTRTNAVTNHAANKKIPGSRSRLFWFPLIGLRSLLLVRLCLPEFIVVNIITPCWIIMDKCLGVYIEFENENPLVRV
jgi:hypothetical protein